MIRLEQAPSPYGARMISVDVDGPREWSCQTAMINGREMPVMSGASLLGFAGRDCTYDVWHDNNGIIDKVGHSELIAIDPAVDKFCCVPPCVGLPPETL